MTLAEHILAFNSNLRIEAKLPDGVHVLYPFHSKDVQDVTGQFYHKYYNDNHKRILLLGINPGRFGAGVTGIPFTDPVRLESECGISNAFDKKAELSSEFIYHMIKEYGGTASFYSNFFISSLSPLGFTYEGKNLNFYDVKELQESVEPFILESLNKQIGFGVNTKICFCIGEGKNFKYFSKINQQYRFFKQVIPLAHPRYIMQYKRKMLDKYLASYVQALKKSL